MERVRKASVAVLRNHVGAAAEFVVDDAIAAMGDLGRKSEVEAFLTFLLHLRKQMPPSVDASAIESEIRGALQKRLG